MNGALNIEHKFPGLATYLIIEWVKANAPGTPVIGTVNGPDLGAQDGTQQTQVFYPAPHNQVALSVTGLPEVWFIIRFWGSSDGTSKDVFLFDMAGNARTGSVYPITKYEYVVGRGLSDPGVWADPAQDDTGLRDTRLLDKTYFVSERGTGPLLDAEIVDRSDDGGGFDFYDVGKVFNDGGVYVVFVINNQDAAGDDSGSTSVANDDIYVLTETDDYDPLVMSGRTIIVDGTDPVVELILANKAILPDGWFILQTHEGSQNNAVIQLDAGDTVKFRRQDVNKIVLGAGESIKVIIKNNELYVVDVCTDHDKLGQRIWADINTILNTLPCDGVVRTQAEWPRAVEVMDLVGSVSYTLWNTSQVEADGQTTYPNRGKWARDDVAGTFRPPLADGMSLKVLAGVEVAGRYGHQAIMDHAHHQATPDNNGGNPYMSSNYNPGSNFAYGLRSSSVEPSQFLGGKAKNLAGTADVGSTNQAVNNIGLYLLVCI